MAIFIPFLCFPAVVAGWAESQQPSQQSGCTALSGKQEGVWEEGDGHRGAELGGRLSASNSLLIPLHRPALAILPLHRSFIFTSSRQRRKKKSNSIRRTQVPPWKKRKNETTKPQWTYTCLPIHLRKTRGGEINLMFVFLFFFFNAWCEISYC